VAMRHPKNVAVDIAIPWPQDVKGLRRVMYNALKLPPGVCYSWTFPTSTEGHRARRKLWLSVRGPTTRVRQRVSYYCDADMEHLYTTVHFGVLRLGRG
jgi:hypothetical protein